MDRHDHCEHGVYIGGSGVDWMCHWCESGISMKELIRAGRAHQKYLKKMFRALWLRDKLLALYHVLPPFLGKRYLQNIIVSITLKYGR